MHFSPEGSSPQVFCFQPNKKKLFVILIIIINKNQESLTIVSFETEHFGTVLMRMRVNNGTCYYHTVATVSTDLSKFS